MVEKKAIGSARILTQVNHRYIYTQPWTIFFKLIKDNVTDPKSREKLWVYGSQPKYIIEENDDSGLAENYPVIVLPNVEVSEQTNFTLNYSAKEYLPMITIEIFSDRNDYLDTISNDIHQIILDNETFFSSIGIYNVRITNDNVSPLTRNGLKIFHRIVGITFEVATCQ